MSPTKYSIDALIEALAIFKKYNNEPFPTKCEHDMLIVNKVRPEDVTEEDKDKLDRLGFFPDDEFGFISYVFGSN